MIFQRNCYAAKSKKNKYSFRVIIIVYYIIKRRQNDSNMIDYRRVYSFIKDEREKLNKRCTGFSVLHKMCGIFFFLINLIFLAFKKHSIKNSNGE